MSQGIPNKKTDLWKHYQEIENGCWEWQLSLKGGYGQFSLNNWCYQAHRVSYELHTGEKIPENMCVCHSCDNPKCINPDHLFLGTEKDNLKDKIKKDRQAKGEKINTAKLTRIQVLEIKNKYTKGTNQTELSVEYGVSQAQISSILRGKSWNHVAGKCKTRRSKLTESQVIEIYNNVDCLSIPNCMKKYQVSRPSIDKIRSGESWSAIVKQSNLSLKKRKENHHKGELKARSI